MKNQYLEKLMNQIPANSSSSLLREGILSTMAYFHIFKHPLNLRELYSYIPITGITCEQLAEELEQLTKLNLIFEHQGFYALSSAGELVARREQANARANRRMKVAWRHAKIIAFCPFVEAVLISGSMGKGVLHPDDDIDFFIVTQPGRLWIVKVLLTIFKRFFLLNSYRNFCLNYFVDVNSLSITERNRFTATEIALVLPMYNNEVYKRFMQENSWCRKYYPSVRPNDHAKTKPRNQVIRLVEKILGGRFGDRLDDWFLKITLKYLARKYNHLSREQREQDLQSSKSISRHHPDRQQFKVLKQHEEIFSELLKQLNAHG